MTIYKKLTLSLLLLAISHITHAQLVDKVIVIVNDEVITQNEWDQEFNNISLEFEQRGKRLPDNEAIRKQVLEKLILRSILLQEAKQQNIIIAERQVQASLKRVAASNKLSLTQFRQALKKQGQSYVSFHENVRQELTIQQLQRKEARYLVNVSDQEIKEALALAGLSDNKEYHTAHILLPVPEAATPQQVAEQLDKINELKRQLDAGANFNDLAQQYSSGSNALEGGDLGWRKKHELPSLFADVIDSLSPKQYSKVLRSPSGFHILQLIEKRNANLQKIPQTQVRHILIKTDALQNEQDVIDKLSSLRDRILQGEDFATLAKANSVDHVSASQGGELGWLGKGETVPAFDSVMQSIPENEISQPFKSRFGWHILQVTGHREINSSETAQQANVKKQLLKRKQQEALELWQKRLRDQAYVKFIK